MRLPDFITFTGADDNTSVKGMIELSKQYPIEWGILFSESNQGKINKYPSISKINEIVQQEQLILSAHLCGKYSRDIMNGLDVSLPISLFYFDRIQVNHIDPNLSMINEWNIDINQNFENSNVNGINVISQWRELEFPEQQSIQLLYDCSGGQGIEPKYYPKYPGYFVGYAGGISSDNVLSILEKINATGPYWIDMESKIRDENDNFDLNLCRKVCQEIYG